MVTWKTIQNTYSKSEIYYKVTILRTFLKLDKRRHFRQLHSASLTNRQTNGQTNSLVLTTGCQDLISVLSSMGVEDMPSSEGRLYMEGVFFLPLQGED